MIKQTGKVFVGIAAALIGCGGGNGISADLSPFAGEWIGTVRNTASGAPDPASLILTPIDTHTLEIVGVCPDTSGPHATPVDAQNLVIGGVTCPAVPVSGCASVVLTVQDGTASLSEGNLAMTLRTRVTGCSQDTAVNFIFYGQRPGSAQPVARIFVASATVTAGQTVQLVGSGSMDPASQPLQYSWSLQRPAGSAAVLDSATAAVVNFRTDVAGSYTGTLVVSAGGRTSTAAQVTVVANPAGTGTGNPPVASLTTSAPAATGVAAALDASKSTPYTYGAPLAFSWELTARPVGSVAQITEPAASVAHLTPDVAGTYGVKVTVFEGSTSASQSATLQVQDGVTATLAYRPIAARYSRALDRLVFVTSSPAALHLYDPVSGADQSVALPLTPTCLSLSSDGLYAAVGHDAWLTYLDLAGASVVKTWPTTAPAGDVVLGDPITVGSTPTRFAYIFPSRDQWVTIHNLDLVSGAETASGSIYAGMRAVLQPGTGRVFGVTAGLSPAQIYRFDAGANGVLGGSTQSPYWGDYPMGWPMWVSGDGVQLLTAQGTRFRTQDLTYAGTVTLPGSASTTYLGLAWADPAPDNAHWLLQPTTATFGGAASGDSGLAEVDAQYLAGAVQTAYPPFVHSGAAYYLHGRSVFYDSTGAHRIAVTQVDPSASALLDFVVLRY